MNVDWIQLIVIVAVFGFAFWGVQTYLKVAEPFKGIIMLIMILAACAFALNAVGVGGSCGRTHISSNAR